jgi:hypothetical protein
MQLMSKPTYFMTNSVIVLRVHVVATCYSRICNYTKGRNKILVIDLLQLMINMISLKM